MNDKRSVLFDVSKNELFRISDNYKTLARKLKGNFTVLNNKEEVTSKVLTDISVFVLAGPRAPFTDDEFNHIREYIERGGSLLVALGEGGEKFFHTNVNFLLEEYGMMINNDCVIRTQYYKYFHPKECLLSDGIVNGGVNKFLTDDSSVDYDKSFMLVYPFGATINVVKPAIPILSSGSVAFPVCRPVCAFYSTPHKGIHCGKIVVLGSGHMFSDKYLSSEKNEKLREMIFTFLTSDKVFLNNVDAEDPELLDYVMAPDTTILADNVRGCLQESTDDNLMYSDYTHMFNQKLYSLNMKCVPKVLEAYEALKIRHESLRLIPPQFNSPLPPLQPAVFPPSFRDLPVPALELFDLEDSFGSERTRLAQLANKCITSSQSGNAIKETISDVEYFILEAGIIFNIRSGSENAASLLQSVMTVITDFRKNAS
ncbi:hypothetical protein V9T40_001818 [Parthenolecanium corni]|uniref:Intraflagellar transport 52 n=1 Tax=Parthenolecanium corni TaxID=536013 RepID=A0AAN9Y4R5_9HEMI